MRHVVDIVLLPRTPDAELLVALNARLLAAGDDEIRLALTPGPGRGLPHLSLAMGVLEEDALAEAKSRLGFIADELQPLTVSVRGIETRANSTGGRTTSLSFEPDPRIDDLHARVMVDFEGLLARDPQRNELVEPDDGDAEQALAYVRGFAARAAGCHFDPHITLGHGGPLDAQPPAAIIFDRLALCALGPGCTCRLTLLASDAKRTTI